MPIHNEWNVVSVSKPHADTLEKHTDPANNKLKPHRQLLHELVTQLVTERDIYDPADLKPYGIQLFNFVENLSRTDAYKALEKNGLYDRQTVSLYLDGLRVNQLPAAASGSHTTIMITGGPGTGKSALAQRMAKEHEGIFSKAARINPDDYRAILADPTEYGSSYADAAQQEMYQLFNKISKRLKKAVKSGSAPHIVLDIVAPTEPRMQMARNSSKLILVAATVEPEIALKRAFERGKTEIDRGNGKKRPGRIVPSKVVLEGSRKASEAFANGFTHPNAEIKIFSTDVPVGEPQILVAEKSANDYNLNVNDPDRFTEFMMHESLNEHANSSKDLYGERVSLESLATSIGKYTSQNINLRLIGPKGDPALTFTKEGVTEHEKLYSRRESSFYPDLAKSYETKIQAVDKAAEIPQPSLSN